MPSVCPAAFVSTAGRRRQIEACKQLAVMVRTSMGPNGMNKMVINHLERLFVTSDARTIVTELEVQHPAGGRLSLLCPSSEPGGAADSVVCPAVQPKS